MINAFIFFAHLIFILVVFTKKWQDDNLTSAFLNMGMIALLFIVGWSVSDIIATWVMKKEGLGILYDRDTFKLTILSIAEFFFFRMYYHDLFVSAPGTETQSSQPD
jgi:hypothetical protein